MNIQPTSLNGNVFARPQVSVSAESEPDLPEQQVDSFAPSSPGLPKLSDMRAMLVEANISTR